MRILLIEDEVKLRESLAFQLCQEGFETDACANGEEGLYYIRQGIYDLILLDRMLPGLDGAAVLSQLRREGFQTPVILITALGSLEDKIEGLDLGADDYLVKPFAFEELTARIRSVLRRPRRLTSSLQLSIGDLTYSPAEQLLKSASGQCTLSGREAALFEAFLRNPGQTLTRELLLAKVWGMDSEVEDGNLDNYIHFLRRRLKNTGSTVRLQTIRGVGYRLE